MDLEAHAFACKFAVCDSADNWYVSFTAPSEYTLDLCSLLESDKQRYVLHLLPLVALGDRVLAALSLFSVDCG